MDIRRRKKLLSAAYRCAFSRLSLNYYTFCDTMLETPQEAGIIRGYEKEFAGVLEGFLRGENRTEEIDGLRRRVSDQMMILVSYADCFLIYRYVLDRMERRFEKMETIDETPEEFADRIIETLSESEDAVVLDDRLRCIVSQLPVRYTKQKFYDLLMNKLTVFVGVDRGSLDELLYVLKTSAMLDPPQGREEAQPELEDALVYLRGADYRDMDKAGYASCKARLEKAVELLEQRMDASSAFMALLNDLYVLFLSRPEAMIDVAEDTVFRQVVTSVREHFSREHVEEMDDALTSQLEALEGIQESSIERIRFSEDETDEDLKKIEKLFSTSPFVELDEEEPEPRQADREWVEAKGQEFCRQLDESFKGMPKPVMRAVMATVLAQLPMTFASTDELREYIIGSLSACTDFAEREASMENVENELLMLDMED